MSLPELLHRHLSQIQPCEPLWKRAPTRDADGRPYSDFMMLIPGLRQRPKQDAITIIEQLAGVLNAYQHAVVFADLNPRLNLLWVSIRPTPGMVLELATAINHAVPEARIIADRPR